jgi:hypothetical protein
MYKMLNYLWKSYIRVSCALSTVLHGHDIAWMHSVRNSGLCHKFPESLTFEYFR